MKVCPHCGYKDNPLWKPNFFVSMIYWEYAPQEDFKNLIPTKTERKFCSLGGFWFDFEDEYYYYKLGGKTRKIIRRFPKGYESMINRKSYEKTPSEKGQPDLFQRKLKP